MHITCDSCSRARLAASRAMNSQSRCAVPTTAQFTVSATRKLGGQQTGIDPIKVARKLWKQTRIEEGRIQADPKAAQAVASEQNSKSEDPTVVSRAPST